VRNQAPINNADFTLTKSIRLFVVIVVSSDPGESTQTDCDDDDENDDDDDDDDDDIFFDEIYIFGIGVLSFFFCECFWTGVSVMPADAKQNVQSMLHLG